MQPVPARSRRRSRVLALVVALVLLLTGCNLQIEIDIDVQEDGSGVVRAGVGLDAAAREQFSDLDALLVFDDLEAAGWTVTPPEFVGDREWVYVSKPFANPDALQAVLDELTGPDRVFTDWEIVRESDDVSTNFEVTGEVDLTEGLETFTDAELLDVLDDPPLGLPRSQIEANLDGLTVEEAVDTRVVVRLPGADEQVTTIALGETATVEATAEDVNRTAQLIGWVRWAILALFLLSLVLAAVNWWLDRRYDQTQGQRRPGRVAERVPGGAAAAGGAAPAAALQLLVVDVYRVLFKQTGDPDDLLIPFARERGSVVPEPDIIEAHRDAMLGRMTSAELWEAIGVDGDASELDAQYLSRFKLASGAKEFLREMHRRGMPIAVISNDLAEWSYGLRDLHGMQGMMPWVVSAEAGVLKPDPAIYEAVRRFTGLPFGTCLMIDGEVASLDTARDLGMMTAWFTRTRPDETVETAHPVLNRFGDFFRRRRATPEPV